MTDAQKNFLVGVAALEGVIYSIIVYLSASLTVWSDNFFPSAGNGEMIAIKSTVISTLSVFLLAWIHKVLQRTLCKHGPPQEGWAYAVDLASSLGPPAALVVALLVDWIAGPAHYLPWAKWYLVFVILIVVESVIEDVRALRRY